MTLKSYCFTDNLLEFKPNEIIKYAVWQKEKGTHEHYQGYIELTKNMRIAALKKIWPGIHFEARKGSQAQAIQYCKKTDTRVDGPWEFGTPAKAGARTDIMKLTHYARSGKSRREMPDKYLLSFARYTKFYLIQETLQTGERRLDLQVLLAIGPTGTGKTRMAYDNAPDLYSLPIGGKNTLWFDGYDGQEVVLMDDFSGQIRLNELLRLLDIYPITVPTKGAHVLFKPKKIIITTNIHPCKWYKYKDREEQYRALCRRIHEVIRYPNEDGSFLSEEDKNDFLLNVIIE